eukprot:CAMPEP_0179902576 /NCGR_PEP_ID=MMETSP0982-20121206/40643_1 /TAXON_ID=483367 /ORGANISM="non described non described, Strain CCMP 2436" /LENGTH=571 /DNA_ID=CAMNT_0021801743 /DNA_START=19 /DNA_END=1735 /DNA_ORIENTATION=+
MKPQQKSAGMARPRAEAERERAPMPKALSKVHSAVGSLERSGTFDQFSEVKQRLLAGERRNTVGNIFAGVPRVVKFDRSSPLADLAYIAQPGITSRVSTRASMAAGGLGAHNASYLRLTALDSNTKQGELGLTGDAYEDEQYVEENAGFTPALKQTVGVALLSSFSFGYNNGNMNTQAGVQRAALGIPNSAGASADNVWALSVSLFCVGALLGCNLSASLADKWGRKKFLLISAAVYLIGGLLEAACVLPPALAHPTGPVWSRIALLIVGRLVTGVACGGSTVVVPMYLGEVSPAHLRGMLGTAFQLTCVCAMTIAQVLGLGSVLGTPTLWPLVLGLVAVPAGLQLALGHMLIESPRWHCAKGNIDEAQATLQLLRDADAHDDVVVEELDVMLAATDSTGTAAGRRPGFADLFRPPTRYPLLIAMTLMAVQQFSGINNAFNYSSVFLKANGMDDASVVTIAIMMNVGNVLVTLLSVYLMDRDWPRPCSVASARGDYADETRALASSAAATTNWLANFISSQAFLVIANSLGGFAFVPFGVCLMLGTLFVLRVVPETKGKSLEQIQAELAFS